MGSAETRRYHVVVFDDPEVALAGVVGLREAGFVIDDVHTPFPVHGMPKAMGLCDTRLAYAPLVGGCLGLSLAVWLQTWTHSVSWPLNVGGKTMTAIPAIVPVSFELTVLLAGIATVAALLIACRLRPKGQIPASQPHPRVNDDRFVVVVTEHDGSFEMAHFRDLAEKLGSVELRESWRVT